jgi:Programmed cell death protein 2, C-terminal putative domain
MPQLLNHLGLDDMGSSIDWATLAIFTCSVDCEAGGKYGREFLWKQDYKHPQPSNQQPWQSNSYGSISLTLNVWMTYYVYKVLEFNEFLLQWSVAPLSCWNCCIYGSQGWYQSFWLLLTRQKRALFRFNWFILYARLYGKWIESVLWNKFMRKYTMLCSLW